MAKTARAAIEDLLTCESCHAFYYVERAEDGARTRLRCTSCGHSRDVLLSGAKTNKWTVIDPSGEVKTFTEWDDLVRTMSGSGVTAVRAKLPSDQPISARAVSEAPPAAATAGATLQRAASERPAPRPSSERPPMHDVQPIGPSVTPEEIGANGAANGASAATAATAPEQEEEKPRPSMSGAALLDVTPNPIAPALSLEDSGPLPEIAKDKESDKSIDIAMSEPNLPAATESKPEALVEALVSSMPDATTAAPPVVEKTADVAPVQAKQEPWDDDEAEVLSMRDIQVVPVAGDSQKESQKEELVIRDSQTSEARNSSTPPPPARGTLRTLPPQRLDAPPPPTITFEEAKKSDPPPKAAPKTESTPPAKTADKAKSEPPKKDTKEAKDSKDTKDSKAAKKPEVAAKPKDASRTATTMPPKSGASAKPAAASAKAQVAPTEESGGRSWLLPAIGVAAAAAVVWYLASGPSNPSQPTTSTTATATATTAAPENTTATTAKAHDPSTTTTTTTATTATATPTTTTTGTTTAPTEKAATANVKPADPTTANTGGTTTEKKPANNANLSMSEALDKAGAAKRSGDYASAKDLYARVLKDNPSNVEAHSGLGDIARAQGDLAAAKASYQKALQASPDYGPALLNLADTEWDMGDRASAQQRYAKIVAARGGSAPARAKERAGTE